MIKKRQTAARIARCISMGMLLSVTPLSAHAADRCLSTTDPAAANDAAQINGVRDLVASACPCASFDGSIGDSYRRYEKCVKDVVTAEIRAARLRSSCAKVMKRIYMRSTCGRDPLVQYAPCVTTAADGEVSCTIRRTKRKDGVTLSNSCRTGGTFTRSACATHTNCLDAADTNGDLIVGPGDSGACVTAATATPEMATPTATPTPTATVVAIDCVVTDWSPYSSCSAACGGGTQERTRTIVTAPSGRGAACPALSETQPCNTQPCAIDCVVTDWSPYSSCSAACGGGTQGRTRSVVTSPSGGGAACPALSETQPCNSQPCTIDCVVSDWSPYSSCSAGCGGGTQGRTRTIVTAPSGGGAACPALSETQPCNSQPCAIDCVVTDWSPWSACSVPCGGGSQGRTRSVVTSPSGGGALCPTLSDTQPCNPDPCP